MGAAVGQFVQNQRRLLDSARRSNAIGLFTVITITYSQKKKVKWWKDGRQKLKVVVSFGCLFLRPLILLSNHGYDIKQQK